MKNNFNNYKLRKEKEFSILNSYAYKIENYSFNNIVDIINSKNNLVRSIREKNRNEYDHNLTNNTQVSFHNKYFDYTYTYERFNGLIQVKNFASKFYKIEAKNNNTYFTNSGMTAITSLLSTLCLLNNIRIEMLYDETYFETIKYINVVNKNSKKKALYIDTIASDFTFDIDDELINKYDYIIVDTTCYLPEMFSSYVNKIKKPLIFVRSHTKIDLIGTEYSHIGSISFLNIENNEEYLKIEADCKHLIGVYGACLIPENYPTFMMDNKLSRLGKIRNNIIKENTNKFAYKLREIGVNIEVPNHQQFCMIYLGNINIKLDELKKKIIEFCNKNREYGIYHAVSFGFDYIAIDCYQNFIDNTYKIRVSLGDMPDEIIDNFAILFIEFLLSERLLESTN